MILTFRGQPGGESPGPPPRPPVPHSYTSAPFGQTAGRWGYGTKPRTREWPYVGLLLLGCLMYGSALGVLLAEWAVKT